MDSCAPRRAFGAQRQSRPQHVALLAAALALAGCAGRTDSALDGASWRDSWWTVDAGPVLPPFRDGATGDQGAANGPHVVQVLYLVPSDAEEQPAYTAALQAAAEHVQAWLGSQLGDSRSITLADPVVQVLASDRPSAWFATNARQGDAASWFHYNAVEAGMQAGLDKKAKDRLWLVYVDAPKGCGQWNWGFFPAATYPENDLLGLVGKPTLPICSDDKPTTEHKCRWVGGMALLMSYALGLKQPVSCKNKEPSCPDGALTWTGYRSYPVTYYPAEDIAKLRGSPFISEVTLPETLPSCE